MPLLQRTLPFLGAALFFLASPAQAGWLTVVNPPPSNDLNMTVGSTQLLTLPGLGGTATVRLAG